jgi:HEAT repeat protein
VYQLEKEGTMLSSGKRPTPTVSDIKYLNFKAEQITHPKRFEAKKKLSQVLKNNELSNIVASLDEKGVQRGQPDKAKKAIKAHITSMVKAGKEDALIKLLRLDVLKLRKQLDRVIASTKDAKVKAILSRMRKLLKGAYVITRRLAVYGLGQMGSKKAYPVLEKMSKYEHWTNLMDKAIATAMRQINAATATKARLKGYEQLAKAIKHKELGYLLTMATMISDGSNGKIPFGIAIKSMLVLLTNGFPQALKKMLKGNKLPKDSFQRKMVIKMLCKNPNFVIAVGGQKTLERILRSGKSNKGLSVREKLIKELFMKLDVRGPKVLIKLLELGSEMEKIDARLLTAIGATKDFNVKAVLKGTYKNSKKIYKFLQVFAIRALGNMGAATAKAAAPYLIKMMRQQPLVKRNMDYIMALEAAKTEKQRQIIRDAYANYRKAFPSREEVLSRFVGADDHVDLGPKSLVYEILEKRKDARLAKALAKSVPFTMSKAVLREVTIALGKLKDKKAVPLLKALYMQGRAKDLAIVALGRIGDKSAVAFLRDIIMRGPDEDAHLAIGALCYNPNVKMDKVLKTRLIKLMDSKNFITARAAALVLGAMGEVRATPHLVGMLRSTVERLSPAELIPTKTLKKIASLTPGMSQLVPDRRLKKFKPYVSKVMRLDPSLYKNDIHLKRVIFGDTVDPDVDRLSELYPSKMETVRFIPRMTTSRDPFALTDKGLLKKLAITRGALPSAKKPVSGAKSAEIITGHPAKTTLKTAGERIVPRSVDPERSLLATAILKKMESTIEAAKFKDISANEFEKIVVELGKRDHPSVQRLLKVMCFNTTVPLSARKLAIATLAKSKDTTLIPFFKRIAFFSDKPELQIAALGALSKIEAVWTNPSKSFAYNLAKLTRSKNPLLKRTATSLLKRLASRRASTKPLGTHVAEK